jgi:hypothetical protein
MAVITFNDAYRLALEAGATEDEARTLAAIAGAESSYNTEIHGDIGLQDATWGPSVGLWQIRSVKSQTGTGDVRDINKLADPVENAKSALSILRSQGWKAWSTYTNGSYKKYLDGKVSAAVGPSTAASTASHALGANLAAKVGPGSVLAQTAGFLSGKPASETLGHLTSSTGDSLGSRLDQIMSFLGGTHV